tara:strand:+ start:259 stop:753 length:495 start_codon:yes stop_codon:yes gene_type:complete
MTVVALTAFVTVTDKDGNTPPSFSAPDGTTLNLNKFQNGKYDANVNGHTYLSFIYQGAAMNRTGDNLEASLVLANSPLSMGFVNQFVEEGYYVEVEVWLMNTDFSRNSMLTKEYWLASGMRYDPESIELLLSSAIDAVGANVPQKSLSTEQCKQLPLTGTIQNR